MISEDQVRLISAVLASIPLSLILRYLKGSTRKYFSLLLGTIIQFIVYGNEVWVAFATHFIVYAIIAVKGR